MLDKALFVRLVERSMMMGADNPMSSDTAYVLTADDIWEIAVKQQLPVLNAKFTVEEFPEEYTQFLVLLTRKEIYFRLASASAPFYPLEAEGATLRKDVRFDHYSKLIQLVSTEYAIAWGDFQRAGGGIVAGKMLDADRHLTNANRNQSSPPAVSIKETEATASSIGVIWSKFSTGVFESYQVLLSTEPLYDKYMQSVDVASALQTATYNDVHRIGHKFKGLTASKAYTVTVLSKDSNGLIGVAEVEVTTTA